MLPFDIDRAHIAVSKHFRNTWMRKWGWDQLDLREAIREAYQSVKSGRSKWDRSKWDIYMRKNGDKKLVVAYDAERKEILIITGAEG